MLHPEAVVRVPQGWDEAPVGCQESGGSAEGVVGRPTRRETGPVRKICSPPGKARPLEKGGHHAVPAAVVPSWETAGARE